jgi:apolipoprotein D and lipocalin family protein
MVVRRIVWLSVLPLLGLTVGAGGCGAFTQSYPPLATVDYVDLDRYQGTWYEIARYPNSFERGCTGVTAQYAPLPDGRIRVVNKCRKSSLNGPVDRQIGVARVVDRTTNAKLKVQFFWPFEGDYYIIDLDPDYQYAVVGEPSRKFFWILSRTPSMDAATFDAILARMPDWRYDPDRLFLTPQRTDEEAEGADGDETQPM